MADPSRPVTGYPAYPNGRPPPPPPNSHPQGQPYPYTAPPPPDYSNNYANHPYYSRPNPQPLRPSFLRSFLAGIIVVFIIIAVIFFIIWLVLRPQLPDFRVDSFQVTNFSMASQSLSALWVVGLTVNNPNKKMTVSYEIIDASVYYKNGRLSETRIPPFTQDKRTQTPVNVSLSSIDSYVEPSFVSDINEERRHGTINFNIFITARLGFRAGWWRTRRRYLRVLCDELTVGLPSSNRTVSGKFMSGPRGCRVGI